MTYAPSTGLSAGFAGRVFRPGEPGFADARTIFNAMIDRRPALIASARPGKT